MRGYYTNPSRADDCFVPFSNIINKGVFYSKYSYNISGGGQLNDIPLNDEDNTMYDSQLYELSSDYKTITVKKAGTYDLRAYLTVYKNTNASAVTSVRVNDVLKLGKETESATAVLDGIRLGTLTLQVGDKISFKYYAVAWSGHTCGMNSGSCVTIIKKS